MTTIPGPRRRSPAPPDSSTRLPAISTNVDRSLAADSLSSASSSSKTPLVTTTPDAINFYRGPGLDRRDAPPAALPGRSFDNLTSRSVSGPLPNNGPRPAKSIPSLSSQKRSVRDLAAQFNQGNTSHIPMPVRSDARSSSMPARKHLPPSPSSAPALPALPAVAAPQQPQIQRNKLQKTPQQRRKSMEEGRKRLSRLLGVPSLAPPLPNLAQHDRSADSQPYLFGEVAGAAADPRHIAHGIPRHMPRRGSEGSMRRPNAMFPRPSNLDLSAAASPNIPAAPRTTDHHHHRSRSDLTDLGFYAGVPRNLQSLQDVLPPDVWRDLDARRGTSQMSNGVSGTDRRPVTPPSYNQSFPQTAAESSRHLSSDQPRLKAYIKESPPKTSPPLRSSRPRQQVSSYAQHSTDGNAPAESAGRRVSALQELSNAVYQQPRLVPRLELSTAGHDREADTVSAAPHSATETEGGATDFEVDTPPRSAHPSETAGTSFGDTLEAPKSSGRRTPSLSIQTQVLPHRPPPTRVTNSTDSPVLADDRDTGTTGTIQIILGDRSLLNHHSSYQPQSNGASPQDVRNAQASTKAFATPRPNPPDRSASTTWSIVSSGTTNPGRLTLDSTGYSAIHNIINQYSDGSSISPQMIEDLGRHVVEGESSLSPRDAVFDIMRQIDFSRQNSTKSGETSPLNLALHVPGLPFPRPTEPPNVARSTASHDTDIEDNGSSVHEDEQRITSNHDPHPRKDSSTLTAEDNRLLSGAEQARNRNSSLTISTAASDQPSLPEIRDTGGTLDVPDTSRISIPPQFPEFVPDEFSPLQTSANSSVTFDRYKSMAGQDIMSPSSEQRNSTPLTSAVQTPLRASQQPTPTEQDVSGVGNSSTKDDSRLVKRRHIINELINTEFTFHRDMTVVEDIYMGTAASCSDLTDDDVRVVFGNTPAIASFSRTFADALKEASRGVYTKPPKADRPQRPQDRLKEGNGGRPASLATTGSSQHETYLEGTDEERDQNTRIGYTFKTHLSKIERLYSEYLKNHEASNTRMAKLKGLESVTLWLNECRNYAKDLSEAWDLDSMTVKPTQRITKYPLLLHELLRATPKQHPDYADIESSFQRLTAAIERINESKKRTQLLDKIINPSKPGRERDLTKPFSTMMKGRADKFKQNTGMSENVEDSDYVALSQKFGSQHLQLQVVMKDLEMYRSDGERVMKQLNALADAWAGCIDVNPSQAPDLESKWRRWGQAVRELTIFAWADHVIALERHCIQPIKSCLALFERPQNLIKERKRRLPEYASYKTKKDKGDKVDKKYQDQADEFMALNDTLKEELPKLYELSADLVRATRQNWFDIMMTWNLIVPKKMRAVLDDPRTPSWAEIKEAFSSDHQYGIVDITNLSICNGSLLSDTSNFLTSSANSTSEDVRPKRPSHPDSNRRGPSLENQYDWRQNSLDHRGSGASSNPRPSTDSGRPGWGAQHQRMRSNSGGGGQRHHTSHGRPTAAGQTPNGTFFLQRTPPLASSNAQSYESAGRYYAHQPPPTQRQEVQQAYHSGRSAASDSTLVEASTASSSSTAVNQNYYSQRSNGVFSSALPPSDGSPSRSNSIPQKPSHAEPRHKVLWLAASLFDFKLDSTRTEAGFPYLCYDPGEIFDVIGERGELWLARNQDDPNSPVGWIWEKHFAKLINDQDEV